MKSTKIMMAAALLALGAANANAKATYTDNNGDEYTFKGHWFLDLQVGGQYTLGEAKFSKLISPNFQGGIGYQFTPVFGLRGQMNGIWSRGGWNGYYVNKDNPSYTNNYKFKYVAPGLDFMFNLSNLFCGWNPNRVFNVTAFLGGGLNWAGGNQEAVAIANNVKNLADYNLEYIWTGKKLRLFGRGGVELNFRVSKAVSIMLEGNANIINDHYNSKKAGNPDWYFNALAGVRINLGKSYTKTEKPVEEPAPAPEPVQEYVAPAPEPVEEKVEEMRRDVFFLINQNKIRPSEDAKIKEIVDFLNAHPDAKVEVTGYADAGTGNDKINDRIAKKRADAVVWMLEKKYGIDSSRISSDSKGARVQPFSDNDSNRVSIMIAK